MLYVFLGFIVLSFVASVITGAPMENIPSEFNYSPDVIALKSR